MDDKNGHKKPKNAYYKSVFIHSMAVKGAQYYILWDQRAGNIIISRKVQWKYQY